MKYLAVKPRECYHDKCLYVPLGSSDCTGTIAYTSLLAVTLFVCICVSVVITIVVLIKAKVNQKVFAKPHFNLTKQSWSKSTSSRAREIPHKSIDTEENLAYGLTGFKQTR